jgi:FkbM family methyltransferase
MFEPSPACQKQIQIRSIPNARLIGSAVGEAEGVADLHFSSECDGSASLHARHDSYFADLKYIKTPINVIAINSVVSAEGIEFIDYMKMDIEGHELFALKGAITSLKEGRIGAISFEFGSGNINSRTYFRDFWKILTDSDFEISRISPGGKLIPIREYYEDLEYFRGVSNYLAEHSNHRYKKTIQQQ